MKSLVIAPVLLLAGCATAVSTSDINRATAFCKTNGGVSAMNTQPYGDTVDVRCKNTASFKFKSTGN